MACVAPATIAVMRHRAHTWCILPGSAPPYTTHTISRLMSVPAVHFEQWRLHEEEEEEEEEVLL